MSIFGKKGKRTSYFEVFGLPGKAPRKAANLYLAHDMVREKSGKKRPVTIIYRRYSDGERVNMGAFQVDRGGALVRVFGKGEAK